MELRSFFTSKEWEGISAAFERDVSYYLAHPNRRLDPVFDFDMNQDAAMVAYAIGDSRYALQFMMNAVEFGFPPDSNQPIKNEYTRQLVNVQNGGQALLVGIAAHLLGWAQRRDEILAWSVERLVDTKEFVAKGDNWAAGAALERAYAMLASRTPWNHLLSDLELAKTRLPRGAANTVDARLARTLWTLVQVQQGNTSRADANEALIRMIKRAWGGWPDRMNACFHALYLQSTFPDVFDPVLPPFPEATSLRH